MTFALLLTSIAFAGCSGSKSADTSADASPAAIASSAASDAPAAADAGSSSTTSDVDNYDPCKKLTVADVQPLYSGTISMAKETDLTELLRGCTFRTASKHSQLQVVTTTGEMAVRNYNDVLTRNGETTIPVPGVGDKAVRNVGGESVYAMKGDVFCMADESHSYNELRGTEAYEGKPLPEALAGQLASKLGALCQKMFAN
jgi:hypothetical protein